MTTTDLRPRRTPREESPVRSMLTRARFWIAIVIVVLLAAAASLLVLGSGGAANALDPAGTQPTGAKAVVSVLRQQGIRVVTTSTLDATERVAAADPENTTILSYDAGGYLDKKQWKTLAGLAEHTVVVGPEALALGAVAPGVKAQGQRTSGSVSPRCSLDALAASMSVTASGSLYSTDDDGAVKCLPAGGVGGYYGLVQLASGARTTTILGASSALTNQYAANDGNAAFALRLLGESPTLIWYLPSIDDLPSGTSSLAELTPGWVTPSILLLAAAAVVAAVWRGRRFGPLVVENLPVVVRSTETMEGRARLYERGANRQHALDQVRIGTLARLASLVGLQRNAGVDEVVARVADILAEDPRSIREVLVDAVPTDDSRLIALSDRLRDLETATARAVRLR